MFKSSTIRLLSYFTIGLSILTFLWSCFVMVNYNGMALMGVVSNVFFFLCGTFGLKLSKYDLQESEFKSLGIRLIIAIAFCLLNLVLGVMVSFILSVVIFGSFYALKSNYDEWAQKKKDREAKVK